jgi:hypothetical protein
MDVASPLAANTLPRNHADSDELAGLLHVLT